MATESPGEEHKPEETSGKRPWGRLLQTRAQKVRAAILGAIGVGVVGFITASTTDFLKSTAERTFGGPALSARVVPSGDFEPAHPFAPYFVVPSSSAQSPTALSEADTTRLVEGDEWALENRGVAGSPQVVRVELRGKSEEPVIVEAIRVDVVSASDPVSGWFVANPGCGVEPVRVVNVDLDASPPDVTYFAETGELVESLALRVTRTDPEILEFHASTARSAVDWTAEVLFSGPDGADSVQIDDGGDPFHVTTETASEGYRALLVASGGVSFHRERAWDQGISAC
jgi:hypothetical protein